MVKGRRPVSRTIGELHLIPPGYPVRFVCDECATEFEVTLEPNGAQGDPKPIELCPFCGTENPVMQL